ncbi:MAG: aminomethyl-transferring glycine dehydrogenase subunit GcvPA [Anaerolineae bacterium]|nr:aminomethyl-transferring glycine dehydrogenase subunit GcvPA [Anaerolineae bacterium]
MSYYPHTEAERTQMLEAVGVKSLNDLFEPIPQENRFPNLNLPEAMSEMEIVRELSAISSFNASADEFAVFLGAGAYHHFIPSVVDHIIRRGEFLTSYTPYQPEVSQGTLQAVYEFQSMISVLTGMEAANASHYDGATSLAEAVTMAYEIKRGKRKKIIMSPAVNPMYRDVVQTYHQHRDLEIKGHRGNATIPDLVDMVDAQTLMVIVQYPDFFGKIQDLNDLAKACKTHDALLVIVTDPVACAILKPPGAFGADIAVGEGQSLGIPLSFGGPYLGFFATKNAHVRKIAGRIVGETVDTDGRRAFVMTLRPREQDIRREKATSNICTNQGLMALAACVHMSALGKHGLKKVAELCWHKSHYAAQQIDAVEGYSVEMDKPFLKEFVVKCPRPVSEINERLLHDFGIVGGYDLGKAFAGREKDMLVCVTEMNPKEEIDALVEALKAVK